jgi:hypothetical protein
MQEQCTHGLEQTKAGEEGGLEAILSDGVGRPGYFGLVLGWLYKKAAGGPVIDCVELNCTNSVLA